MENLRLFDWRDRGRNQRRLETVRHHIIWCYSGLSVSRRLMRQAKMRGEGWIEPRSELSKMINRQMTWYLVGLHRMRSLDRDDQLALDGGKSCMHCGDSVAGYHMDHLVPTSRLGDTFVEYNQVRSCPRCNLRRGNKDLMIWYRENQAFPTMSVLRRYLKICFRLSDRMGLLDLPEDEAILKGLPFVPSALPRRFPPVGDLVWDHSYPGRVG